MSPAESVGAEWSRLDRAGGPAPGLPRGPPACPLPGRSLPSPTTKLYFSAMWLSHCPAVGATLPHPLRLGDICVN